MTDMILSIEVEIKGPECTQCKVLIELSFYISNWIKRIYCPVSRIYIRRKKSGKKTRILKKWMRLFYYIFFIDNRAKYYISTILESLSKGIIRLIRCLVYKYQIKSYRSHSIRL